MPRLLSIDGSLASPQGRQAGHRLSLMQVAGQERTAVRTKVLLPGKASLPYNGGGYKGISLLLSAKKDEVLGRLVLLRAVRRHALTFPHSPGP